MLQVLQCGMLFTLLDIPANSNVIYCILLYFHLFQDDATLTSDILNLMWFILFCLLAIIEFKALCQSSSATIYILSFSLSSLWFTLCSLHHLLVHSSTSTFSNVSTLISKTGAQQLRTLSISSVNLYSPMVRP